MTGHGYRQLRMLLVSASLIAGCSANTSPPVASPPRADAGALGADRVRAVPTRQQPWRFGDHEGQIITTPHYRLYTTLRHDAVLDRLPVFLERGLAHYTTALGELPQPPTSLETYLFETRNQWEAKTRQMLPDQATTFLTLGRGGFTTRGTSVLYYIGRSDTLAIASHEGWHQYSQRTLRQQLPLWLEEGIATYMEGYLSHPDGLPKFHPWANLERYHTLREVVRAERLIPLPKLLQQTPQSFLEKGKSRLLVYYAQVWALAHFLAEGEDGRYRPALERLLSDAADGRLSGRGARTRGRRPLRLGPDVLVHYFESDLEEFEARYVDFMRAIVRTGGRGRVVEGRSPLEE